jgi:hypothetical protein
MAHVLNTLATVLSSHQRDTSDTHPTTTPFLAPRRRQAHLLALWHTLMTACMRRRPMQSRWIRPDLPRLETSTEFLARRHTYLYIHSLSG